MRHHLKAMVFGLVALGAAFITALGLGRFYWALISLGAAFVLTFIFAVAWLRAKGHQPEHHPATDKLLDDTHP